MPSVRQVCHVHHDTPMPHIKYLRRRFFGDCLRQCAEESVLILATGEDSNLAYQGRPPGSAGEAADV